MSRQPVIYLYDGSLDAMLHAIAVAIKSGQTVAGIFERKQYVPTLYDKTIDLQSDAQQAVKLFDFLKKYSNIAAKLALHGYLSEDKEAATHLYRMVLLCLENDNSILQCHKDTSIAYLHHLSQKVGREAHRFTGLIRFRVMKSGLMYAPFEPDCNIIGYCAEHFKNRFAPHTWLLHDIRRDIALLWDSDKLREVHVDEDFSAFVKQHGDIPASKLIDDERYYQKLWQSFHTAITNKNRLNPVLQKQKMPQRYWKYLVEAG